MRVPESFAELVECYAPRMKPHHRIGGVSALRLWRLPYPRRWSTVEPLEVVVAHNKTPPRTVGVRGRRLATEHAATWRIHGVAVVDPVAALFGSAPSLSLNAAVVLFDAILTTADNYPRRHRGSPVVTRAEIERRLIEWGSFHGCRTMRAALELARERVESPKETETRLMVLAAGLPEPVVQYDVRDGDMIIARLDLAYPRWKIAIEYEGDGHRVDKHQWRIDIRRQRELEDRGWIVIRLTELDLSESSHFVARVRRAIDSRSRL